MLRDFINSKKVRIIVGVIAIVLILIPLIRGGLILLGFHLSSLPPEPDAELAIPATVSDVRLTIAPSGTDKVKIEGELMRVYYGFLSSDKWQDYPFEHYDLIRIPALDTGYDGWVEHKNHAVKFGQYLLITIKTTGNPSLTTGNKIKEIINISDTISSEVNQHFEEYYSPADKKAYGLFMQTEKEIKFTTTFGKWYSVLLEYDKLPTDYVLTVVCTDVDDNTVELTLTYDDIQELLATTESEQSAS